MSDEVWGTGYGSKRHLIAEGTRQEQGTRRYGRDRFATAACSSAIFLSFFSDGTQEHEGATVMEKQPCPRCVKKAALQVCPTCDGAGVVKP